MNHELQRRDAKATLSAVIDQAVNGEPTIPLDIPIARALGTLSDFARSIGSNPDFANLAIAATALSRGYTVLTRNVRHFRDMPVASHDPFDSLPTPG